MIKRLARKLVKRSSSKETQEIKKTAVKAKKTASKKSKTTKKMSQQEIFSMIEKKAYELFEKRGYMHGDDQQDWYEAESTVTSSFKK